MTPKELFLELLKQDGQPDRQLSQYEALYMFLGDPVNGYLRAGMAPGCTIVNRWGVTITWPENSPGSMPVTENGLAVCKDITKWKEQVHIPDIISNCKEGWDEAREAARAACGEDKLLACFMATGIFEQCHFLMGFEETLTNLYEHPQEMKELIDCITDFRIEFAKQLIEGIKPDVIFSHDDWGTKDSLFMNPDMWREFFKEPYRKLYGYIRSQGVMVIHHADSYLAPIVEDMAEIGIQAWQGVLPENNIPELQRILNGKMILMGGLGAAIDRADATPEEILDYTHTQLEINCPGGHYIPCITYGLPGTVYPHVDAYLNQAIEEYNKKLHVPRPIVPDVPKRIKLQETKTESAKETTEESKNTLDMLATALFRGQQKKVLQLCEQAISEGIDPQDILSNGLVKGMAQLGEAFSANRAFVPEMLIAAKCMSKATEFLKPYLTSSGNKSIGKACLGTVKGDMHDIGKNLVKIMMEGSGIEVIDLGVDVEPEVFVKTAKDNDCDIIACSSLLTTTMQQMRKVVTLASEEGIRENVKILVGGAPISQSFCDEIGADAYTEDAAAAARMAVSLIQR